MFEKYTILYPCGCSINEVSLDSKAHPPPLLCVRADGFVAKQSPTTSTEDEMNSSKSFYLFINLAIKNKQHNTPSSILSLSLKVNDVIACFVLKATVWIS